MKDIINFFKDLEMEKHYKHDEDVCEWCKNYKTDACKDCDEGSLYSEEEMEEDDENG